MYNKTKNIQIANMSYNLLKIKKMNQNEIKNLLDKFDQHYYNGSALISDEKYDKINEFYHKTYNIVNKHEQHTNVKISGSKVKLPIYMGSMNKAKPDSSSLRSYFKNYVKKNKTVIMSKLDGESCLIDISNKKVYTRGNGKEGKDISSKLKYLNNFNENWFNLDNGYVRGELIIELNDWNKISDRGKNIRNFVSGVMNRKKLDNKTINDLGFIKFIAYERVSSDELSISEQLKQLNEFNYEIVRSKSYDNLVKEQLPLILNEYKTNDKYEIDGLIIQVDLYFKRNTSKNPKYAIAFKMDSKGIQTVVRNIRWEASQQGKLIPIVEFDPIQLNGSTIKKATGHNASFIQGDKTRLPVGIGSLVEIIKGGEVIPKIQSVLSGGNIIWPKSNFVWDKNKTDIYLVDKDTKEVKLKKLEHFITKTGIGFYKSGLIKKGYEDINIKTIENFINLEKKDLLKMTGIKETSADKIIQSKNNALNNIHISTLASSTGYFPGVGERRMLVISEKIPNFLEMEYSELKNKIIEINGFSDSIANVVINGIEEFKKFISFFQKKYKILMKKVELKNTNGKLSNDIFIFTGFRDKNLEEKIKSLGGSITKNMNKKSNITYLVTKDINSNSIKLKKANEWNIKIINQKMLEQLIK